MQAAWLAGSYAELIQTFEREPSLHETFMFNIALTNLQFQYVPEFYATILEKLEIRPNAGSIALLIRGLGRLGRFAEAEQVWWQWEVRHAAVCLSKNLLST